MIIKKAAGLMSREEAEKLNEACSIYLVKEVRFRDILFKIKSLGFFDAIANAMENFGNLVGRDSAIERIELDNEELPNRTLEFYTIDSKDYNWIMETSNKLGRRLTILQLVQMGNEFDLDNLVALVPIETGLGNMDPAFKSSVVSKFNKLIGDSTGLATDNLGEIPFKRGIGAYSTGMYDLSRGRLFGATNFSGVMKKVASIVSRFDENVGFVANARTANLEEFFYTENEDSRARFVGAAIVDVSPYNEKINRDRTVSLSLNYDFLDKFFSPRLKKQMLRRIRKFIGRRGQRDNTYNILGYMDTSSIGGITNLRNYPFAVFGFSNDSRIENHLQSLESFLKGLSEISIEGKPYSIPEDVESEIIRKLETGLSLYYENNGLTRPITTLEGKANRFRSRTIRSIFDDAIASSLPGFSQPTGQQRGFRLEKSYTGLPTTLKDLSNENTFNDLLRVKGEIPTYITKDKKQRMYKEYLTEALEKDFSEYLESPNFKSFIDISENNDFTLYLKRRVKEMGSNKIHFILNLKDKSNVDIGMSVNFEFKFSLPDFTSNTPGNLTLEEVDVERYFDKTSQSRYTVDVNKIEDLNIEMVDIIRRVYEPRRFFSSEEGQQAKDKEGRRITSPAMTAKGFLSTIFREQANREDTIVLQDLTIDNLTGRVLGILYYPGLTGDGFYLSVDDRKSGLVRTRPEKGEIFVVCSGGVVLSRGDRAVTESVCSYAQSREDFQASMDSAIPAFQAAGAFRLGKINLENLDFVEHGSKPGDIAHIEVGRGQSLTLKYKLKGTENLPTLDVGEENLNTLEEYLKTRLSYADGDATEFIDIRLECNLNVYQPTLKFNIFSYYRDQDGDKQSDRTQLAYVRGKLPGGIVPTIDGNGSEIILDENNVRKIMQDIEEKASTQYGEAINYIKTNKKELVDKIRRRVYGYELSHTGNIGSDYSKRSYGGKINE